MNTSEALTWFEDLSSRFNSIGKQHMEDFGGMYWYESSQAQAWVAEAGSAIGQVFPSSHNLRQSWDRLVIKMNPAASRGGTLEELPGVIIAATMILKHNRHGSLIDSVRAETEADLLDQACDLLQKRYLAAAAVIAGGALETHLRHLAVTKHQLLQGEGTISKYDQAISTARNNGTIIYSAIDSRRVQEWGAIRNDAAHKPGEFNQSQDQVRHMIEEIRDFLTRIA